MQRRWDYVIDREGRPVEGAAITVTAYPGGAASSLYSDDGTTLIAGNILTSDSDGFFAYYAANGHYTWSIATNEGVKVINDVTHDSLDSRSPFIVVTGTGNAMVVPTSSIGTLNDGDELRIRAVGENTSTAPTITVPVHGVLTIYKLGGQALNAQVGGVAGTGDIRRAGHEITLRFRASPARMELLDGQ